jgi:hypothetical protein
MYFLPPLCAGGRGWSRTLNLAMMRQMFCHRVTAAAQSNGVGAGANVIKLFLSVIYEFS